MKIFSKKQLTLIIVAVFVFCILIFSYLFNIAYGVTYKNITADTPTSNKEENTQQFSSHLKIPSVNIDAIIENVDLTPNGTMEEPKNPMNVALFSTGPQPGEIGSAVIVGNYSFKNRKSTALYNLYKINRGDKLYVEGNNGKLISFIVTRTNIYNSNENDPEIFVSNAGSHLNLITSIGNWDKSKKSYPKRLVVFSDLVP